MALRCRRDGGVEPAVAAAGQFVDDIAEDDAAAARAQAGIYLHLGSVQRDLAAGSDLHGGIDGDIARGVGLEAAQLLGVEPARIEEGLADQAFGHGVRQAGRGHAAGAGRADVQRLQQGRRVVAQLCAGGIEYRHDLAQQQFSLAGRRQLRLAVAVQRGVACRLLALALEHARFDAAFQHRGTGADDDTAGVTAHDIAVFQAFARADQGVGKVFGRPLSPALVQRFEALIETGVQHVAGRRRQFVELAILAAEPALANHPGLHIEGAAGNIERGTGLGHQFAALERHRAALRRPFADAMATGVQVAAHFEQAAARVPAVGRIAIRAGRHPHQVAPVDPQVGVVERLAVAVAGRVALLVALRIDQHVVRSHRHVDADGTGNVDAGAARHVRAARGQRIDLAAGGQGQRAAVEDDVTAGGDLDQRQVAAVVGTVAEQG